MCVNKGGGVNKGVGKSVKLCLQKRGGNIRGISHTDIPLLLLVCGRPIFII